MAEKNQKYIIRCDRAGVFYAEIAARRPLEKEADLANARKIHYWDGAAAVEQIAMDGVDARSRLTVTVPFMTVMDPIQVIQCTDKAIASLDAVKEWRR